MLLGPGGSGGKPPPLFQWLRTLRCESTSSQPILLQSPWCVAVLAEVLLLGPGGAQAGQPLPPEAQYLTMQEFRKVNPDIVSIQNHN